MLLWRNPVAGTKNQKFLTYHSYHNNIIKISVKAQFVLLINLSKKLLTSVATVESNTSFNINDTHRETAS